MSQKLRKEFGELCVQRPNVSTAVVNTHADLNFVVSNWARIPLLHVQYALFSRMLPKSKIKNMWYNADREFLTFTRVRWGGRGVGIPSTRRDIK